MKPKPKAKPDTKAMRSKIGRLPWKVRDQLNEMLRDGRSASAILTWLNGHIKPPDKPITASNLSDWRATGYKLWLDERRKTDYLHNFSERSASIAKATGGSPAGVAAKLMTEKLLNAVNQLADGSDLDPEMLGLLTRAITQLTNSEAETRKLDLREKQLQTQEETLRLNERKFLQDKVELFMKWLEDKGIVEIATGGGSRTERISAILDYMNREEDAED